jgi:multidrug resistance efflux pump
VEIARKNIAKTKTDGELEARKNQLQMAYLLKENANTSVHAEVDGVVIHAFNQWRGERYDEGVPGFSGHRAGQVMTDGAFELIAWALEADRLSLKEGMPVYLTPDAYPGKTISSTIKRISPAPEAGPAEKKGVFSKLRFLYRRKPI